MFDLSALYFAGLKAGSADMQGNGGTVNDCLDGADVGLPHLVGSSVRMAYGITEMNAFLTNITLCHDNTSIIFQPEMGCICV